MTAAEIARGERCGRQERSARSPMAARCTHFRAVRWQMLNARATAATVSPARTRWAMSARLWGVVRAFLWTSIRIPPPNKWSFGDNHLRREASDGQSVENPQLDVIFEAIRTTQPSELMSAVQLSHEIPSGRRLHTRLVVLALLGSLVLLGASPAPGSTYFLSPSGNNRNAGAEEAPWKTFAFALGRLVPGDTLVLLDGRYDSETTGLLSVDCASGARHGTSPRPITIMAQNERRALIVGDGQSAPVTIQNCSYWHLRGLYTRQIDNARAPGGSGFNVYLRDSRHLTVQRCLAYGANRYTNVSIIVLHGTHESLIEECEAYFFHRKGISLGGAARNTIRRNYVHSRFAADVCRDCEGDSSGQSSLKGDEGINLGYPGSDNLAENNISEGSYIGFTVNAKGASDRNRFYGNIAIDNDYGFLVTSRGAGTTRTPHDTVLSHNVALRSARAGVYLRGAENTRVSNLTVLDTASGHGLAADHSSLDYVSDTTRCNKSTSPCGNGASSTHIVNSLVLNSAGIGLRIVTTQQEGGWSISFSNAYNNRLNYSPSTSPNLTDSKTVNPLLGPCKVWIPDGSSMRGAGRDGTDIGANILYRYQSARLTLQPLWNPVTGALPSGALVADINDLAGQSAFDVHRRLNVNTNGCSFPTGYAD
jgi:hypothetical protein